MNHEDYCSYEQAVKLKEKGFDWPCDTFYDCHFNFKKYATTDVINRNTNGHHTPSCSAPTLSLVQKWLREEHEIYIVISPYIASGGIRYIRQIWHHLDRTDISECRQIGFKTYELALSDALTKALELI